MANTSFLEGRGLPKWKGMYGRKKVEPQKVQGRVEAQAWKSVNMKSVKGKK